MRITKTLWILPFLFLALAFPVSADLTTGIERYYAFDTGNGTTAIDSVGNQNATINGATWTVSGIINDALDFDGTNDFINIGDIIDENNYLRFLDTSNELEFYIPGPGWSSLGTISASTWYHVVIIRSGTNLKIYLDNSKVVDVSSASASKTYSYSIWVNTDTLSQEQYALSQKDGGTDELIGMRDAGTDWWWNGKLDEFAYWNRSLTADEVSELYASGSPGSDQQYPFSASSLPFSKVKILDLYDNATLSDLNVTWTAQGVTNTTDGSGVAQCNNCSGDLSYTVDGGSLYFNASGTGTENATVTQSIYGALVTLTAQDLLNDSVSVFNVSSGLQSNTTSSGSLNLVLAPNTTNTVYVNGSGYYPNIPVNVTTTAKDTGSYVLEDLYEAKLNITVINSTSDSLSNFSVLFTGAYNTTLSTTTTLLIAELMQGDYELRADVPSYAYSYENITLNTTDDTLQFTVFENNQLNITFYDEETGAIVNNVDLSYYSDTGTSGNQSTTTGTMTLDLQIPNNYILIYDSVGYDERHYEFTIADRSFNNLNLTLLNATDSTTVTITVKETLDNRLTDAVVKIYRFDISENEDDLIEVRRTNFEGVTIASMLLNSALYRFVVEIDGEALLTTARTQIYGNEITLVVNTLAETGFESVFNSYRMSGAVTFSTSTNLFTFTYNDESNTLSEACIDVYRITQVRTLYNSTCSSASAGVLTAGVENISGRTYQAFGYITGSDGNRYEIDSEYATFQELFTDDGSSLLMMILVILAFGLLLSVSVEIAIVGAFLVPLIFTATKLTYLDYNITVPLAVAGIILAFIMGVIRK